VIQEQTPPVILVGGIGLPWLRDLDFGTQFVRRVASEVWPSGVVVDDLSYAAHRVLHRLQELAPERVVLLGAMPRGVDPPGTVRRYFLDLTPPPSDEVHQRLTEAVGGIIDLDHTLAVCRHWMAFPDDTVVIEVEPGDRAFGLGFSDPVEAVVDEVLAMVHEEVARPPLDPDVPVERRTLPPGEPVPPVGEFS
jgi:hydrogenase maturation protease